MAEIILENPWPLLALPLFWLLLVAIAWRRRFKPFGPFLLRLAMIVLVMLALSRPVLLSDSTAAEAEPQPRLVVLVDQSASLGAAGQQALRAEADRLTQTSPEAITLFFADRALVAEVALPSAQQAETEATPAPVQVELETGSLDPNFSNLAAALSLGAELLNGQPGRLVLLSDGLANQGDTMQVATALTQQQIPVDVLLPTETTLQSWQGGENEVRLLKLTVPPRLRQGESFDLEVTLHSLTPAEATLNLTQDGTALAEDNLALEPGLNLFTFTASAAEVGPHTFRATVMIEPGADAQQLNNTASAFTQVYLPPQVLVVGEEPEQTARFADQLKQSGYEPQQMRPADLPSRLSELEAYAGMVLVNVSARPLELEQMLAVQEFVRSLGRGLLVTGGRDSFSVGNYQDTPLADLLPVSLEPPPREERPPVALLLVIDHSGSMMERSETATKLAMAKEAAIRATDILGPQDLIGVLMFDNLYDWVVSFQRVSDGAALLQIQQNIAGVGGGGGTRILQALEVSLPALAEQEVGQTARLAVLLTDGKSFDGVQGVEDYNQVVDDALAAGITLSTIAIGTGADQELLSHLAERGQGRYHFAETPDELPALTIAESDILRSNAIQEGEFRPAVFAPHPLLRGLLPSTPAAGSAETGELPDLSGYLAQTPKPRAEIALQVGPGDPLLTVWGYGLGRVAAWTSDTGADWARSWMTWDQSSRFWGQVVGYTLPAPDLGLLQLEAEVEPDGVAILTAEGVTATGQTVDLARTEARLITPGGREIPLSLRQTAPGRYQQQVRLPDPGAYQLSVTQARADEPEETATTGFVIPYPAEYGLPAEETGEPLLRQIAEVTGGRTFSFGESFQNRDCQLQTADCQTNNPKSEIENPKSELWYWLLLAALILWPLEIAWRRWGRLRIQ